MSLTLIRLFSMETKEIIPKLRFNQFTDGWHKSNIGHLYKNLRTGQTPSRSKPEYFKGDIPWITSGELNNGYVSTTIENITEEGRLSSNLKIYKENTFFIAITGLEAPGTRGKCAMNSVLATTNQSCLAFEEIDHISNLFLFYWYSAFSERLYFKYAQGTKQQSFNNKIVEDFKFSYPSKEEQQKIASFLSSVDEKISQLEKKKTLLETYKRGVMQKIFSQELRFKDENGEEFPEWEDIELRKISTKITKGTTPTSLGFSYQETGINFIKAENLTNNFKIKIKDTPKISEECNLTLKRSIIMEGDILFSIAGTLGRTAIVRANHLPANTNQALAIIRLSDVIMNSYVNFFLNSISIKKRIQQLLSVGAQPNLSLEQINNLKILLPHKKEQQKIASFLSSIDNKIEITATQLEKTREFKKGLLQQMFV